MSPNKEKKRAHMLFKRLKVKMISEDDLTDEDIRLLEKYYPFIFN